MPDYRLYVLNPRSGHIDGVEEFHSADDVEAITLIQHREGGPAPLELWRGGQKIKRFDARPDIFAEHFARAPTNAGA